MRCWNCHRKIPDDAKACRYCEASVEDAPTVEEMEAVEEMLGEMPPEVVEELTQAFEGSTSAEEFVNRIMVGDCPKCGSSNTGDCDKDPDLEDICVGRCFTCGQLWCLDCGELFEKGQLRCRACVQ
jgi:hypothetical protein